MRVGQSSRWGVLAIVIVVASGCGGDDSGDDQGAVGAASTAPATMAAATETPSPSAVTTAESASTGVAPDSAAGTLELTDAIVLERDGLGAVAFGDDADPTIAAVTAVLGQPSEDSGWVAPSTISSCAGTEMRAVAWGALYLYFADQSAVADGRRHLFGYSYGHVGNLEAMPEGLATSEGIGLGTTVEFLRAAYPDIVVEEGEEGVITPNFYVDEGLSGRLTGGADDDLVTVIIGGDPCAVGM